MDAVQYYYLKPNKILLYIQGLWPHQKASEKILVSMAFVPTIMAQLVLQSGGLVTSWNDPEAFMEVFAPLIISFLCLAKFFNFHYHNKEMKDLLTIMEKDWNLSMNCNDELHIMEECYKMGRKVTVAYAGSLYAFMFPFMAKPMLVKILSALGSLNASTESTLMFRVENFVDVETYYYLILVHSYFGTLGFITVVVGVDTMIMLYVQHGCAISKVLGYRLKNSIDDKNTDVQLYPSREEDLGYKNIRGCILLHKHLIEYARRLNNANTVSFFVQLGLNMISITFTGFQAATHLDKPNDSLRYACFTLSVTFVLFLGSWPGQQILDHTERITELIMNIRWYAASMSTRKLISVMLMRSLIPIKLTAGPFYALNLENFSSVVRTSFSYFTVLCSMQ